MNNHWEPEKYENEIYKFWEDNSFFTPKIPSDQASKTEKNLPRLVKQGGPFTIILPPPNANAPMHMGHAMYVIEDIMIRYHRMLGEPSLFLPGTDHAGIETQYVFEKKLKEEGKSRFDFDRETLYRMIAGYVDQNRGVAKEQMKKLGFALDWTREKFTLDPKILETVLETFRKLYKEGLIYRAEKMVNYCTRCGTAFSELEVVYEERKDPLYYMKYGLFTLATVRPETKFGDTAVAVHPDDKRYKHLIGQEFVYDSLIGPRKIKVVADEVVDPEFGTGAVKVTPAHDPNDFEIAKRHNLPLIKVIGLDGKMTELAGRFAGLYINQARKAVVEELQKKGDIVKIDENYTHRVGLCYRCKNIIEPMVIPQWFVKIEKLAKPAIKAVEEGKVKIVPARFKKVYLDWMNNIKDWNISRQIVWGPRIPAWYCLDCNPGIKINFLDKNKGLVSAKYAEIKDKYDFEEIKNGLQSLTTPVDVKYFVEGENCPDCDGKHVLQETDTFDTWFSSGQWPLTTLGYPNGEDFKYFYPTSVLDTMFDILFFWVARMIMFGIYLTGEVPFKVAHMHSRVVDIEHKKMSKSKGNVIDPVETVQKYGADALRMALVYGTAPASDIVITEEKIVSMRNFCNKIWNAARFVATNLELKTSSFAPLELRGDKQNSKLKTDKENIDNNDDKEIIKKLEETQKSVKKNIEKYYFGQALEEIYQFFWHEFCDKYIEAVKNRREEALPVLLKVLIESLKMLHPFAPFVTEAVYQEFKKVLPENDLLKKESISV